jgi:hypothetical protein
VSHAVRYIRLVFSNEEHCQIRLAAANCDQSVVAFAHEMVLGAAAKVVRQSVRPAAAHCVSPRLAQSDD